MVLIEVIHQIIRSFILSISLLFISLLGLSQPVPARVYVTFPDTTYVNIANFDQFVTDVNIDKKGIYTLWHQPLRVISPVTGDFWNQ